MSMRTAQSAPISLAVILDLGMCCIYSLHTIYIYIYKVRQSILETVRRILTLVECDSFICSTGKIDACLLLN